MRGFGWTRGDTVAALALAALALGTRVHYRMADLYSWDSGILAMAVQDYDFASYTPHPPYYPLEIVLARLLAPWTGPVGAISWLAVLASPVLVAGTYVAGRQLGGRAVAAYAGLLAVLSPLLLFNGSVPLSYAVEGAASTVVAALAWHARNNGRPATWVALAIAASLAVGIRPSSAILLAPLVLWGAWGTWRGVTWTGVVGAVATASWVVPMVVAGGGWADFRYGLALQSRVFIFADPVWRSGWPGLVGHLQVLVEHVHDERVFLLAAAVLAAVGSLPVAWRVGSRRFGFLAAWFMPGFLFYALVYAGWPVFPSGYAVALMPPLFIAAALVLLATWQAMRVPDVAVGLRGAGAILVVAIAALPLGWPGHWEQAMDQAQAIDAWTASWEDLEATFPPTSSAAITWYGSTWMRLHHPATLTWHLGIVTGLSGPTYFEVLQDQNGSFDKALYDNIRDGPHDVPHAIPPWVDRIVIVQGHPFDVHANLVRDGIELHEARLPSGRIVQWFDPAGLASIEDALAWSQALPPPPPART